MNLQCACNTEAVATQKFGRPKCPRCGSMLLIAEELEFNVKGRIRNTWSCDGCAHEFVTSITLWPRLDPAPRRA